jgi:hypothetical protein
VVTPVPIRKFRRVKRVGWGGVKPGIGHDTGLKCEPKSRPKQANSWVKSKE